MSLGICPVFEPKIEDIKFDAPGETIFSNIESLSKIAKSGRFTSITTFLDSRPIPEGFDGDPDELKELMGVRNQWFDPIAGCRAIQRLVDEIEDGSYEAIQLTSSYVVVELKELLRVLGIASSRGVRFRLEMS